ESGSLPFAGVRREVSVLYVDLRELGAIVEPLTPEAAMRILNAYVTLVVAAVFRHAGSLSKHTGDTIIAVWNLPLDQIDHAHRAVRAALDIRREVLKLRKHQPKESAIQVGMGVGTGSVIAGHIGASSRDEFTILGEVLGMAERLAMKADRGVFVDLATRDRVADEFETREVNPVRLRRRTDLVMVWEVIDPTEWVEQTKADSEKPVIAS
ncbi:MAG: adenylate/guanylate cyclase domain-containing protein, partial [Chloroflexota bacterium]|nr:adenylate/guanylate cyclase domain-containing protein [Chloroflexota bacterium]